MENNSLPKSLHTIRILVAVAKLAPRVPAHNARDAVYWAAAQIGYEDASPADPLIVKAAAHLAAGK